MNHFITENTQGSLTTCESQGRCKEIYRSPRIPVLPNLKSSIFLSRILKSGLDILNLGRLQDSRY